MPADHTKIKPHAALGILESRLRQGLNVTPICRAIIGWLCNIPTEPSVAEIRRTADGRVLLRLSDEVALTPLCSFLEFLQQVRIICESVGMSGDLTRATVAYAGEKLG
jgi:hypothetical protein